MVGIALLYVLLALAVVVISGFIVTKALLKTPLYRFAFFMLALPELLLAVASVKTPELASGIVLGSVVLSLSLISGLSLLVVRRAVIPKGDAGLLLLSTIIPLFLLLIGMQFSRLDGIILIGLFFLTFLFWRAEKQHSERWEAWVAPMVIVLALILAYLASTFAVQWSFVLASEAGVALFVLGSVLIAVGASLPELFFAVPLDRKGELALDKVLASAVSANTLVLGIIAVVTPFSPPLLPFLGAVFASILASVILAFPIRLHAGYGLALVIIYLAFIVSQIIWSRP